jgi:hypothetical protein
MSHWLELLLEFLPWPGDLWRTEERDQERPSVWVWVGIAILAVLVVVFVWWRNS